MDQLQTNSFIREYIKNESKRGYDHISIYRAFLKRFDASKVGAKYLTNAKVAQYARFSRPVQQFDTTLLHSKNYMFEIHQSVAGNVIVFANIDQLQQLITYGNELVLMDACGSLAGNYLVNLLVRNNLRCWIPCAQFWLSKEHSHLYLFAFNTLINWTSKRWVPTAFLIDGSKIESRAIEIGFGKTRVLRCTRHTTETLRVKLSHVEDALFYMEKAVFAETLIDCYQNIQQSIETCPYADLKRYILSKWTPQSSNSWSLHGRSANPLWQEITTTNAIESYHAMVRRCTNSGMNLTECTSKIIELIEKRFETAQQLQSDDDNMVSRVAACVYTQMKSWSLPLTKLLLDTR